MLNLVEINCIKWISFIDCNMASTECGGKLRVYCTMALHIIVFRAGMFPSIANLKHLGSAVTFIFCGRSEVSEKL